VSVSLGRAVSTGRAWTGLVVGAIGLAGLTAVLAPAAAPMSLASVTLLYLVPVLAAAAIGGVRPAIAAAFAADLLVNFFFIPPFHTLVVQNRDHVVVLVVYVLVAVAVSLAVELAAREHAAAARRALEANLLATVTAKPVAEQSLTQLLDQVRHTFGMSAVALLESGPDGEHTVASVGDVTPGAPAISARASSRLRLAGWGPAVFAEDRLTLSRLAAAAARTLETQRLAHQADQAEQLAEIDRARSALLAAVGHDLRTPLAGIKLAVSSLRHPDLELPASARDELLSTVEESADRLDSLIDNLLSMSRLQAGVLSVRLESVALDAVVAQALLHDASQSSCVEVDVPDDLPLVRTDPGLLERVVANLVANARAASPAGLPVTVRGRADRGTVALLVIDHGPGVPTEDWERMFAPFQRLHDRSVTAGLGLGLAITRGFTQAIGATITPSQTPGGGLTMTVTIPTVGSPVEAAR
jgi:K+-sensing histidine kinase KdpD